uniref:Phage protein n=1 Tax=Panagrellus redivivus TaxID=6233 RepID=A0A7E4UU15_PANRE
MNMLRQLSIFEGKDNVYLHKMLRCAFVYLSEHEKACYIAEAESIENNLEKPSIELSAEEEIIVEQSENAALLYQKDIRHIIKQDKELANIETQNLYKLLWKGWSDLDEECKGYYKDKVRQSIIKKKRGEVTKIPSAFAGYLDGMCQWMNENCNIVD